GHAPGCQSQSLQWGHAENQGTINRPALRNGGGSFSLYVKKYLQKLLTYHPGCDTIWSQKQRRFLLWQSRKKKVSLSPQSTFRRRLSASSEIPRSSCTSGRRRRRRKS